MLRYGQFCPVAKTAEIFADRWTPLIVRELCSQPCSFGELLQAMPLISRTMLVQRLKELAEAEVIRMVPKAQGRGHIYHLTEAGDDLRPLIELMAAWGQRWAYRQISPNDLDSAMLMLGAARHVPPSDMPAGKLVVRYEFRGIPKEKPSPRYWWWVIERPNIDVCLRDHGFDVDLVIRADLNAFVHLFLGHLGLREAVAANQVGFEGGEQAIICLCRILGFEKDPSARVFTFPAIAELEPVVSRFGGSELLPPVPKVRFRERAVPLVSDKLS